MNSGGFNNARKRIAESKHLDIEITHVVDNQTVHACRWVQGAVPHWPKERLSGHGRNMNDATYVDAQADTRILRAINGLVFTAIRESLLPSL